MVESIVSPPTHAFRENPTNLLSRLAGKREQAEISQVPGQIPQTDILKIQKRKNAGALAAIFLFF